MDDETHKIDDLGDIDFVIPNGSGFEYGQFLLDTESQNFLLENVNLVNDNLLRGAAWISLWEQVLQNRLNPDRFFSRLLHGIEVEKDELLLETLQGFPPRVLCKISRCEFSATGSSRFRGSAMVESKQCSGWVIQNCEGKLLSELQDACFD
jgi:hypothetical protein